MTIRVGKRGGAHLKTLGKLVTPDAPRGVLRMRGPHLGKKKTPTRKQLAWQSWFKTANELFKYEYSFISQPYYQATKGTNWMPRDLYVALQGGRLLSITMKDGRVFYHMAIRDSLSASLDIVSDVVGSIFVRGTDIWEGFPPPVSPSVLAYDPASGHAYLTPEELYVPPARSEVTRNTTTLLLGGAATIIPWNVETIDEAGVFDLGASNTQVVIPDPFAWDQVQLTAQIWFANASLNTIANIGKTGGSGGFGMAQFWAASSTNAFQMKTPYVDCAPGDTFQVTVFVAALETLLGAAGQAYFSANFRKRQTIFV